jgi:hypothetical protein
MTLRKPYERNWRLAMARHNRDSQMARLSAQSEASTEEKT